MKKTTFFCGAFLMGALIFTSCGKSSIESDAKKVAEIQCKAMKLMKDAASGDASVMEESAKIGAEASELAREMEGKYTSDSDKEEFAKALQKAMGDCQ